MMDEGGYASKTVDLIFEVFRVDIVAPLQGG